MKSQAFTAALLLALAGPHGMQALQYGETTVTNGGTLSGRVTFAGIAPKPEQLLITRDFEVCGLGYRKLQEIDVAKGGGLRNVVVFIEKIERGKSWPAPAGGYQLDQKGCYFVPYIQIVPRGSELQIVNSDSILHNVHGYELSEDEGPRRTLFNLGQPKKGVVTRPLRPRRSPFVRLECDAHDFMLGWMFAADNPYAVVVDSVGRFSIAGIPPGAYTIGAWHPSLGVLRKEITVSAGGNTKIDFEFKEKRKSP